MGAQENCTAASRTDTVGKVFIVTQGMRRCLICNQVFTRQASVDTRTWCAGRRSAHSWLTFATDLLEAHFRTAD
jgi:hypothetical protein